MSMVRLFRPVLVVFAALAALQGAANAASKSKIDRRTDNALAEFRENISGADSVLARASGVLVFPSVKKAGIGIGGEYGEGALRVGGRTVGYYSTAAASIGFQLGAQARTQLIVFFDQKALEKFQLSDGWEIGVDASVAVLTVGAGGSIDATQINAPIAAFVFGEKGLMYNLSLEGSKITEIHDD